MNILATPGDFIVYWPLPLASLGTGLLLAAAAIYYGRKRP